MQIFVTTVSFGNRRFALDVEGNDTIESLRVLIQEKTQIAPSQQALTFERLPMHNGRRVADYAVKLGSTVELRIDNTSSSVADFGLTVQRQEMLVTGRTP